MRAIGKLPKGVLILEFESTSVPARVVRDSFFIGEAHDLYMD